MLVMAPAVPDKPDGVNTIRFGVLKLARFSRLKISARNCKIQALADSQCSSSQKNPTWRAPVR